ncbi:class I SAM-dependent methyltransferase [Litorivicinus sp.]|nr:class I SAM-dependent methyltransferase [Litorivicinus sp.]
MGLGAKLFRMLDLVRPSPFTEHDKYVDDLELGYLINIIDLFKRAAEVPGHIVELGTASGRNALLFGQLICLYGYRSRKQYIGFDSFQSYTPRDLIEQPYLSRSRWSDNSLRSVQHRVDRLKLSDVVELRPGDILETVPKFFNEGSARLVSAGECHVSLLYVDVSAKAPALAGIEVILDRMLPGSIIAIDQKKHGGEWRAMKEIAEKKGLNFVCRPTPVDGAASAVIS